MNEKVLKKLKKFKNLDFIKLEYKCDDCGNIIYRTISQQEINQLIEKKEDFEPIICELCNEEKMIINGVIKEDEFYKYYPNFMSGG